MRLLLPCLAAAIAAAQPVDSCRSGAVAIERRDLAAAERLLAQCTSVQPGNLRAHVQLLGVYQLQGNSDALYAAASTALKRFPDESRFYLTVITHAGRRREFASAAEVAEAGLTRWPSDPKLRALSASAFLALGMDHLDAGRNARAERYLRRAADLAPGDADALLNYGRSLHNLQRYAEALTVFDKLLVLGASTPLVRFHRATTLHALGRFEEAIDEATRELTANPDYPATYLVRGSAYMSTGDWNKALADLDIAAARMPADARAQFARARCLVQLGRDAEAEPVLRRAMDLDPSDRAPANLLAALPLRRGKEGIMPATQPQAAHASDVVPRFIDMAPKAGLSLRVISGEPARKPYLVESVGGGLAVIDFDNDGWLDLYIPNGSTIADTRAGRVPSRAALYRNNRDGSFTEVTLAARVANENRWGKGALAFDFDNDGHQDLYVTNFGPNRLYRNNGNGTFTDVTRRAGVGDPSWSSAAAAADYDRDGDLDLFVANYVDYPLDRLPTKGKFCEYLGIPVACGPRGLKGAPDTLYRNNGDGTFTDVSRSAGVHDPEGYYGLGAVWGDYDNDGDPDLFVANDTTPNRLYRNNSDGTFTDVAISAGVAFSEDGREQACMGVEMEDLDNDGDLDIAVTNFSNDYNTLYRNQGNGLFTDDSFATGLAADSWPDLSWGVGFVDFNNDGFKDLFIANGHIYPEVDNSKTNTPYRQANKLYLNAGGPKLLNVSSQAGPGLQPKKSYRGSAFADFNNDGAMDVALVALDEPPVLLINQGIPGHHWVTLNLKGRSIGARITVRTGSLTQIREVKAGGSFAGSNDPRAHFGLGRATSVDDISVRWPSGKTTKLTQVTPDRILTIEESPIPNIR